jgi:Domain of unknown function (DUF4395)
MSEVQVNFVRQQGFEDATARTCDVRYPALMFQPRVIGGLALIGILLQAPWLFLALSAVLWWNVVVPALNPFDRLYDALIGARKGEPPLPPAPAPRRFAQGVAATFTLVIGACLLAGWPTLAWVLQAMLLLALGALLFGNFCLGSYLFLVLTGRSAFARQTLPWSRHA